MDTTCINHGKAVYTLRRLKELCKALPKNHEARPDIVLAHNALLFVLKENDRLWKEICKDECY